MTDDQRIYQLEKILLSYTTTSEQKTVVANISKMINPNITVKDYVLALADGLRYGNWPWTNYKNLNQESSESICTCQLGNVETPVKIKDCPAHGILAGGM